MHYLQKIFTLKILGISIFLACVVGLGFFSNYGYADKIDYNDALEQSLGKVKGGYDSYTIKEKGGQAVTNFILEKTVAIIIPLAIVLGIVFAIIGFYRVIFSTDAETTKTGVKYIIYGILGILIMMSAEYMTGILSKTLLNEGGIDFVFDPAKLSSDLYDKIAYPFLKIIFYLMLGILFVVLVGQVMKYLFSTDDKMKTTAGSIISWNIIAMFIIIGSKQFIEAVYGKQQEVLTKNITLGDIGDAILHTKELPIIYTIINWIMSLTALVILVIIIYQSYILLTNPSNSDQFGKIKKSILYIFIGIMIIGSGYIITNFLIIN